jgi:hypothetical protein
MPDTEEEEPTLGEAVVHEYTGERDNLLTMAGDAVWNQRSEILSHFTADLVDVLRIDRGRSSVVHKWHER